jgi:hypothetical protein
MEINVVDGMLVNSGVGVNSGPNYMTACRLPFSEGHYRLVQNA